jgi:hypothetical protein
MDINEYKRLRQQGFTPEQIASGDTKKKGLIRGAANFLGMEEFGKGIGTTLANLSGSTKGLEEAQNRGMGIADTLFQTIKKNKAMGKDTSRLEKALQQQNLVLRQGAKDIGDIGTAGLSNRQVLGSAALTGLNLAGGSFKAGSGFVQGAKYGAIQGTAFGAAQGLKDKELGVGTGAITGAVTGGVVGGVLGAIAKGLGNLKSGETSEYFAQKILKQTPKERAREAAGKAPNLASQFVKDGLTGSRERIVEKSAEKLAGLEKQINEAVQRNKNTYIDTVKLVRSVDRLAERNKDVFGQKGVEQINEYKKFLLSKGDKIALPDAHKFVKNIYRVLGDTAYAKDTLPVPKDMLKTIAGAARAEIGKASKPLDALIKQQQKYIRYIDTLERTIFRNNRNNMIGLSDSILAAGGIGAGEPITGLTAGLTKRALEAPQIQSRLMNAATAVGQRLPNAPGLQQGLQTLGANAVPDIIPSQTSTPEQPQQALQSQSLSSPESTITSTFGEARNTLKEFMSNFRPKTVGEAKESMMVPLNFSYKDESGNPLPDDTPIPEGTVFLDPSMGAGTAKRVAGKVISKILPDDTRALTAYIDNIRNKIEAPEWLLKGAEQILEKLGANMDDKAQKLADMAEDILRGKIDITRLYNKGKFKGE